MDWSWQGNGWTEKLLGEPKSNLTKPIGLLVYCPLYTPAEKRTHHFGC